MQEASTSPLELRLKEVTHDNLGDAVTALQKLDQAKITQVIATLRRMQAGALKQEDWRPGVHGPLLNAAIEIQNSQLSPEDSRIAGMSMEALQKMEKDLGRRQATGKNWNPATDGPLLEAVTKRIKLLGRNLPTAMV